MKRNTKGFTLIELLVVVSIVGLLSSIVLASVKVARLKAADTAIIESVKQMRNLMALELSDSGNYSNLNRTWITRANDCVPYNLSTSVIWLWQGNYAQRMTDICKKIKENQPTSYTNIFYINSPYVYNVEKFTIMAQLPYRTSISSGARYVCVGSNGAITTDGQTVTTQGIWLGPLGASSWWAGSGCYGDPSF